jgi:CRISPR/Cas system endoribonuclease Cas6 (RAMP superfamily)
MWHVKELSLLKAVSAKHRSKFATPSPVMVTVAGWMKNCSGDYNKKQTN